MVKLEINKGEVMVDMEGNPTTLLVELTLGCGCVLRDILKDCPSDKMRQGLIKGFFTAVTISVKELMDKEGEDNDL